MAIKRRPVQDTPPVDLLEKEPVVEKPKEPEVKGTKSVKVDADKIVDEEVVIDYMGEGFSSQFGSQKTKENTDKFKSSIPLDKKVGEIREDIAKSENKRNGDQLTFKDILQFATFIINAFDGGIGILLNFIARDNRVASYTLPVETKKQLAEQLALILVKHQVKFKIEFLFLITIVLGYMGPIGGAMKHRKGVAAGTEGPAKRGRPVKEKAEEPKIEQPVKEEPKPAEEIKTDSPPAEVIRNKPPRNHNRRNSRKKATW